MRNPQAAKQQLQKPSAPGLLRRLAAIAYDLFLLLAVLFVATALLLPLNDGKAFTSEQYFYPAYLLLISFGFYGWFWTHGGQTLGMKAWNLKVQTIEQQHLTWSHAAMRFIYALLGWGCLGLGFLCLVLDKHKLTWYDKRSKTCLYFPSDSATP